MTRMDAFIEKKLQEERERLAKLIYGLKTEVINMQGGIRMSVIEVHKLKTILEEPKLNF